MNTEINVNAADMLHIYGGLAHSDIDEARDYLTGEEQNRINNHIDCSTAEPWAAYIRIRLIKILGIPNV